MEPLKPYVYQSLPKVESSFRVLELLPGEDNEELFINLQVADWVTPPPFEALSYAWGDPTRRSLGTTPRGFPDGTRQRSGIRYYESYDSKALTMLVEV